MKIKILSISRKFLTWYNCVLYHIWIGKIEDALQSDAGKKGIGREWEEIIV